MMQTIEKHRWSDILDQFAERGRGKPTRVGVFVEEERGIQDYWLQDGMLLAAIGVGKSGDATSIELMFGGKTAGSDHLTRSIKDVKEVCIRLGCDEFDDSLEVTDKQGKHTVVRFEKDLKEVAH